MTADRDGESNGEGGDDRAGHESAVPGREDHPHAHLRVRLWKEYCFGLTAELIIDRAVDLRYVGGTYGNTKPTPFLCLTLKMLQLQPDKEIILEFLRQEDYKYLRALAAMYIRLTFSSVEIYKCLELLYRDYRKLRYMNRMGRFELLHMDEFIDHLLRNENYCDIQLPRLQKRQALEDTDQLKLYESALDEDLEQLSSESEEEEQEKPRLVSRRRSRSRSSSAERERERERERRKEREDRDRRRRYETPPRTSRDERDRGRRRERSEEREDRSRREDRRERKKPESKADEDREVEESNKLRAQLGLAPLQR
ncbi:Pre-mRNA-splicing factor 38 [Aphelenchoides fujianensis]|nr:Pre-mRNA-splicing factor 38 [Aphelenchoides fujianensis]